MQKLYEGTLRIRNGEQTYPVNKLIYAENLEDAEDVIEQYASEYYGGESVKEDDAYMFGGGVIGVEVRTVRQVNIDEWKEEQFKKSLIGSMPMCACCKFTRKCTTEYEDCQHNLKNKTE